MNHQHTERDDIRQLVTCHCHKLKAKSGPKIESWGTPQDTHAG